MSSEVIPENDTRPHRRGRRCPCRPQRCGTVLVHNAFDLREVYEHLTGDGLAGKTWKLVSTRPDPTLAG